MNTQSQSSTPALKRGVALRLLGVFALGAAYVAAGPALPDGVGGGSAHAEVCSGQLEHNTPGDDGMIVQECYGQAPSTFAAVALSGSTLATGSAWGFGSLAAAQSRAMAECRVRASDCRLAGWAQDGCVAVATGSNGAWAAGWSPFYDIAEARAVGQCQRNGGTGCGIVTHPCSAD